MPISRYARLIAFLAIVVFIVPPALAARLFDYDEQVLDNGLRVVTLEDFSTPVVAVQVWYHVGSKDEDPNRQGFAHMFEHMMFRGTDRLGPEEHFEYVRQTGGAANGFTSFDYTAYVNTVPSNQLELALWLEAERMMFLRIDEAGYLTERQVVEEERRQDLNEPYGTLFERILAKVFHDHPYRWHPIGSIAHLEATTTQELKRFWDTFYVPNNAVLAIVGAVSHEQAQDTAARYFGWIPRSPAPPRVTVQEPPQTEPQEITLKEGIGPVPLARFMYRAVPEDHPDTIPLQIAVDILGDGESSRLYQDLVKEQKICQEAYSYLYSLEQDGLAGVGAELKPGGDLEKVIAEMAKHTARLRDEPVDAAELGKAKNRMRRRVVTSLLTNEGKAMELGRAALIHGDPDWLNRQLDLVAAVTVEDVQRVAQTYLTPQRGTTVRVVPDSDFVYEPDATAGPMTALAGIASKPVAIRPDWMGSEPPIHSLQAQIPAVSIKEKTLSNGLKVVVLPNHEVPFTTILLGLKRGAWTESQPGVASMALEMLTKGTENYTAAQLAETIDSNALTLHGSATSNGQPSMDVGEVSATALADKAPLAMELLAEVVRRPTFPEDELAILKDQLQLALSVQMQDPGYLAERALREALYPGHPYARTPTGEPADIERITAPSLEQWWREQVRPETAVLYAAGDLKPRQVFRLAKKHLGDWKPAGPLPKVSPPKVPEHGEMRIMMVNRPNAVQSQIRLGHISITRGHPLYHASRVFTHILGGGFNSRLNKSLRIDKGLTYAVAGYFVPYRFAGAFQGYTFTKTPTTVEAVRTFLDVVESMRTDPVTDEELRIAKSYLVGSFPGSLETPQDMLAYQWIIDYNNLPEDYLRQAMEAYKHTTADDVTRVAHEALCPDALTIAVAGDAGAVQEGLAQIGPVTVVSSAPDAPGS
jgi:zinc protease